MYEAVFPWTARNPGGMLRTHEKVSFYAVPCRQRLIGFPDARFVPVSACEIGEDLVYQHPPKIPGLMRLTTQCLSDESLPERRRLTMTCGEVDAYHG